MVHAGITTKQSGILYTAPRESFWTVRGVSSRGKTATYQIFEQMTPSLTQDQLAELYKKEKQKGNPHPISAPLTWAIVSQAYALKDNSKEEWIEGLKNFLRKSFRKWPNTLTRVCYNLSEDDESIHNYGTSEQYSLRQNIVGPNDWIKNIPNKKLLLEAVLETSGVDKINKISQWINNTDCAIWRLSPKLSERQERVVGFYADSHRLYLDCGRDPSGGFPAFRVLKVE